MSTRVTSPCKGEVGREAAGRGSRARFARTAQMTARARNLRTFMTDAERKLWQTLRRDQLHNLHFRRQHPIGPYTIDFYCPSLKLAVELDGGQHAEEAHQRADRTRTSYLAEKGILVVRYWNNDVLKNYRGVLEDIARIAAERSSLAKTPSPSLPLSGGGRTEAAP